VGVAAVPPPGPPATYRTPRTDHQPAYAALVFSGRNSGKEWMGGIHRQRDGRATRGRTPPCIQTGYIERSGVEPSDALSDALRSSQSLNRAQV